MFFPLISILGWRVVPRQDPPEDSIDPLRIFMDAQTSESVLKEMGNSQWSEMFFHQINKLNPPHKESIIG